MDEASKDQIEILKDKVIKLEKKIAKKDKQLLEYQKKINEYDYILDNIPVLGPSNANEAKRFVIFIDTVYEARRKLIASADAPPFGLYPKGAGKFEFERTISRLHEMQATSWGDAENTD